MNEREFDPEETVFPARSFRDHLKPVLISIICTFFATGLILIRLFAWLNNQVEYRFESGDIHNEYSLFRSGMMWKRQGKSPWQLVHGFVAHDKLNVKVSAKVGRRELGGSMSSGSDSTGSVDIQVTENQLLVNGIELHPTPGAKVFVLTTSKVHVPIKLSSKELVLFQPDVYPDSIERSDVWEKKFRKLVDSDAEERDAENKLLQEEIAWNSVRSTLGIKRVISYDYPDDSEFGRKLFSHAEFDGYPNGTSRLANAFFTYNSSVRFTRHDSSESNYHDDDAKWSSIPDTKRVYLRPFPAFFKINGKVMERNCVFVQKPDGKIETLQLSESEYLQLTHDSFASTQSLVANDVFRSRIAAAIGTPVPSP